MSRTDSNDKRNYNKSSAALRMLDAVTSAVYPCLEDHEDISLNLDKSLRVKGIS